MMRCKEIYRNGKQYMFVWMISLLFCVKDLAVLLRWKLILSILLPLGSTLLNLVRFFDNDVWKVMSSLNRGFKGISCTFTSRTLLEVNSVIICNVEVSAGSKSFIKDAVCWFHFMPTSSCNRRISHGREHDNMSLRGLGTCGILKQTLPGTKLTAIKAIDNWIEDTIWVCEQSTNSWYDGKVVAIFSISAIHP